MITVDKPEYAEIQLTVNGESVTRNIPTHLRLLDFLRDELGLTAAKESCGEGECGACTILLDSKLVNSCLIFAVEASGSEIQTVEGLEKSGESESIFRAYLEQHAVQCGFCIPGMVMSSDALLRDIPQPDREQIKYALAGNICRCTGYAKIIDAVEAAGRVE
jgi:aerobic carbon-monoxide dehydrogenase small subunit